jgi:hypothetical protein
MKVREVREVLGQLATIHDRLGSHDCAAVLRDLGNMMQPFDTQTVGAFVKRAGPKRREDD